MSDRASNEKKANELLDEWRDGCDGAEDRSEVQQFYCMARVLLGFHSDCCKDLKPYLLTLANEHGSLGKDNNTFLRHWKCRSSALVVLLGQQPKCLDQPVITTGCEIYGKHTAQRTASSHSLEITKTIGLTPYFKRLLKSTCIAKTLFMC